MSARSIGRPEIGKFSTARWVCAPHSASAGTRTSPIESCSVRYVVVMLRGPATPVPFNLVTADFQYQDMLPTGEHRRDPVPAR